MLRDVPTAGFWWEVEAQLYKDAYDWEAAVDDHSKRFWLFEFDDIAWQVHGDEGRTQVELGFLCIDEALC